MNDDGLQGGEVPGIGPVNEAMCGEVDGTSARKVLCSILRSFAFSPVIVLVWYVLEVALPNWVLGFPENDVPIFGVTAGVATIVGVFLSSDRTQGRVTLVLWIAAVSTFLAGFASISDDWVSRGVVLFLLLSVVPVVLAEEMSEVAVGRYRKVIALVKKCW